MKFNLFNRKTIPSGYNIQGENNKIIIVEENGIERELGKNERISGLNIFIHGNDNLIKIVSPCNFNNATIEIADSSNGVITINKSPQFMWHVKLAGGRNQLFEFGEGSTTAWYGEVHILNSDAGVKIGKDCMFSGGLVFLASDGHKIIDINTHEILNDSKEYIEIGDHVWGATNSRFLKGAKIGSNSIVAANSVVTKKFDQENIIVAGNPAKVVKTNINWER